MAVYKAKDFLGKEHITNPADILYLLFIDNELREQEDILDLTGENFDFNFNQISYIQQELNHRLQTGLIKGDLKEQDHFYDSNISKFFSRVAEEELLEKVIMFNDGKFTWKPTVGLSNNERVYIFKYLLNVLAKIIVSKVNEPETRDFNILLDGTIDLEGNNFNQEIVVIFNSIPRVKKNTKINFHRQLLSTNLKKNKSEIDYEVFIYDLLRRKHTNKLNLVEKYKRAESTLKEGNVYFILNRGRVSDSNPIGEVEYKELVRLDKITDTGISVTSMAVNMTYEDRYIRFRKLSESIQNSFSDVLNPSPKTFTSFLKYSSFAIENDVVDEDIILLHLSDDLSTHYVFTGELIEPLQMTDREVAFYALNQMGYEINNEVFIKEYDLKQEWIKLIENSNFNQLKEDLKQNLIPVKSL